jgi:hypothetical protein
MGYSREDGEGGEKRMTPHPNPFLNERVNCLKSVINGQPNPRFGSMKGMFTIMPDFDEPLEDFKEYM